MKWSLKGSRKSLVNVLVCMLKCTGSSQCPTVSRLCPSDYMRGIWDMLK